MSTPIVTHAYLVNRKLFSNRDKAQKYADELNNEIKRCNIIMLSHLRIDNGKVYMPCVFPPVTAPRLYSVDDCEEVYGIFQGDTPENDALKVCNKWNAWNGERTSLSEEDRTLFNNWMRHSLYEYQVANIPFNDHLYP